MTVDNERLSLFNASQPSYKSLETLILSNEKLLKALRNKIVYCNCDNPYTSIIFRVLCLNFKKLGLQKVVSSDYTNETNVFSKYEVDKQPPILFINRTNFNVEYMLKYKFMTKTDICDHCEINSKESRDVLSYCDFVITKPDINTFNEYFDVVARSDKNYWLIIPFEKSMDFNSFRNIKHIKAKLTDSLDLLYSNKENNDLRFENVYALTNLGLYDREELFPESEQIKTKIIPRKQIKEKASNNDKLLSFMKDNKNLCFDIKRLQVKHKNRHKKRNKSPIANSEFNSTLKKIDNYNAYILDDITKMPKGNTVYAVSVDYLKKYNPSEVALLGITRENLNKEVSLGFNDSFNTCKAVIDGVEQEDDFLFVTRRKNYASMDFDWYRDNLFKKYSERELQKQLDNFVNQEHDLSVINNKGMSYNKIINQFLEEVIYSARKSKVNFSPVDSLYNEPLLTRIINYIANKPRFFADDNCVINLKRFYSGACKIAPKVANFSPNAACKIYERLCPKEEANIYDYSCGFGARMLGAIGSKYNYHYYGTDPNERLCVQLNKLGEWFKEHSNKPSTYKVYCHGSEYFIDELEGKIDLAFSSPPYFDLEVYTDDDRQCENKYKDNYSAWVEFYVKPTVQNIKRYLKEDGVFALNIKNGTYGGYEHLLDDWTKCAEDEGFVIVDELTMHHQSARIALSNYMVKKYGEGSELKSGTEPVRVFKLKTKDNEHIITDKESSSSTEDISTIQTINSDIVECDKQDVNNACNENIINTVNEIDQNECSNIETVEIENSSDVMVTDVVEQRVPRQLSLF